MEEESDRRLWEMGYAVLQLPIELRVSFLNWMRSFRELPREEQEELIRKIDSLAKGEGWWAVTRQEKHLDL